MEQRWLKREDLVAQCLARSLVPASTRHTKEELTQLLLEFKPSELEGPTPAQVRFLADLEKSSGVKASLLALTSKKECSKEIDRLQGKLKVQ